MRQVLIYIRHVGRHVTVVPVTMFFTAAAGVPSSHSRAMQEMVLFLQKLPTADWDEKDIEMVLSRAYMLRASFKDAGSHLQS